MPASVIASARPFACRPRLLSRTRLGLNLQDATWGGLAAGGQRRDKIVGPGGATITGGNSKSDINLLVDADSHGIDMIQRAIGILQQEKGRLVQTRIYASPARAENSKWKRFFDEQGVLFHPIPRGIHASGEESDGAIVAEMQRLSAKMAAGGCIALMTGDTGFVNLVSMAVHQGIDVVVFAPQGALSPIRQFRSAGARVVTMSADADSASRVRAILHSSGNGEVQFAEPFVNAPHEQAEIMTIMSFLQDLQFRDGEQYLVQSIVKFWFENQLGSLTVFPAESAIKAALARATEHSRSSYVTYSNKLAFFLPIAPSFRTTQANLRKYGNRHARGVYRGGGPFVVKDSEDLVSQALKRLGFLDSEWNPNLAEAMLAFVNVARNKQLLRKQFDALPSCDDTAGLGEASLRHAFLSNKSDGRWGIRPKDTAAREILCREGFLDTESASQSVVLNAMKKFASKNGLPRRRNYDSYVRCILDTRRAADPSSIGDVQFRL
ncbi:unnamed protein product [Symbiodinium sp. CCMP2592]|nr:unnamed protein product [Symbiodinium sp. CCMP2592]